MTRTYYYLVMQSGSLFRKAKPVHVCTSVEQAHIVCNNNPGSVIYKQAGRNAELVRLTPED